MERMEYWQHNFTELLPTDDPRVGRAHAIFDRILRVAGRRPEVWPRIFITKDEPAGIALPIALPDGGIILSKRVLDLCYGDPVWSEDRLAFVLAHEVAHLLKDDFWQVRFFQTLASLKGPGEHGRQALSTDEVWAKELQADEHGIVYASMAGFNTRAIVTQDGRVNFFADWIRALESHYGSGRFAGRTHPSPDERADVVKIRLQQILDQVEVFTLGLRFYQVGQYARAVRAFQHFLYFFPSREVYQNLAVSHHQLALEYYGQWKKETTSFPFKLSLSIDPETRATVKGAARAPKSLDTLFAEHLAQAVESYQMALSLDPSYALAATNLGGALLLKGDVYKAIGILQDALKIAPNFPEALNNLGVAFVYAENLPKALGYLRQAHTLAPTYDAPVFNLGKIAHDSGQAADAQRYWTAYLALAAADPWAAVVRQRLHLAGSADPWPAPAPQGEEHLLGGHVGAFEEQLPTGWGTPRKIRLPLEQEPFTIALYPSKLFTLSQDREVVMLGTLADYAGATRRGIKLTNTTRDLLTQYGRPTKLLTMPTGESWVYEAEGIAFQLQAGRITSWLVF
jgi:tetratricopeptide (TPR) repeat protein